MGLGLLRFGSNAEEQDKVTPKRSNKSHLMSDAIPESCFYSDILGQKHKSSSYFNVPGLFVGFNAKNSDSDSTRSPTSTLDFRIFSSFGNPFRCPKSLNEKRRKSWDCSKVGLSIIDSFDGETEPAGKGVRLSDSKNILFGRQMNVKSLNFCRHFDSSETPKSLPENVAAFPSTGAIPANLQKSDSSVLFEIGEAPFEPFEIFRSQSLDSGRFKLRDFGNCRSKLGSSNLSAGKSTNAISSQFVADSGRKLSLIPNSVQSGTSIIDSITADEIELSEDYTCVKTHGSHPKVTHIFGDCILECCDEELSSFFKKSEGTKVEMASPKDTRNADTTSFPSNDFLKSCYLCKKNLDGEDIFMYRGDKAFCSFSCRWQEILIDEEMERTLSTDSESPEHNPNSCQQLF